MTLSLCVLRVRAPRRLAAMSTGISATRKTLDDKSSSISAAGESMKLTEELSRTVEKHKREMGDIRVEIVKHAGGGGWKFPFFVLFVMILALAGVGYNRYVKLYGKSHLP